MEASIAVSPLAVQTYDLLAQDGGPRVIRHEGGTSSGKTRNIAHAWVRLLAERPAKLSVVRESGPVLKRSVQEDVEAALTESPVPFTHHRTDNVFDLATGGRIEMLALDDPMKAHGPRRDHLWLNEAPEIPEPTAKQLFLRTRDRIVLDYNPAIEDDHWVFRLFDGLPPSECVTIPSTFRDNPFVEEAVIREIESLKETDPYAYTVYGLGERGRPAYRVLPFVERLLEWPEGIGEIVLGLDFGYHDPMSLIRVARVDGEPRASLYVWALVHERFLTTGDIIKRLPALGVSAEEEIWCDSQRPDSIREIVDAGYNAKAVEKGPGSVKSGVDWLKRHTVYVGGPAGSPAGDAARSELKRYRNKEVRGVLVDEPLDKDNHAADALRYAAFTHWGNPAPVIDYARGAFG